MSRSSGKFEGISFDLSDECEKCEKKNSCAVENNLITANAILADCECFYYAYKKIEKETRMPIFNGDTDTYKLQMEEYFDKQREKPSLTPAKVVNGALAAELALKYLIFKEVHSFDCIHNLNELFKMLPSVEKKILTEKIKVQAHQDDETLDFNLKQIGASFTKWRYFFAEKGVGTNKFFDDFVSIVYEYAISLKLENDAHRY